ncbi:MAG: hypothetical protein RL256_619 [Actinomycetota bacterium]
MRGRVLTLVLALIFSASAAIAAPNPKAGGSCSKVGSTKTFKGKKFTCIKSGKKLVWNKGERTGFGSFEPGGSYSAPTATASPIPSVIPSPTPTPSSTSTAAPVPSPSPTPTKTLSVAERWNATGSSALTILEKSFPAKPPVFPKVDIIWRYSDAVNIKIREGIAKHYSQTAEFWSAYTKIDGQLQVIVGTLDDIEFVCKWRDAHLQMNHQGCVNSFRTEKDRIWDAHTTQQGGKATDFYFMTDPSTLTVIDFLPRVQHEFFHNVQHAQTNQYKSIFPCWVEEAGAEYFGALVASNGDPETFIKLRYFSVSSRVGKANSTTSSKEFWRDWLLSTDMTSVKPGSSEWGCASVHMEGIYHYGLLATEYLNQELGIPGILALYRDAGTMGWNKAIEKAFNKNKLAVYEDIAAYMDKEYRITVAQTWARHKCVLEGRGLQCANGL